jgi:hypothetical protein
LRHFVTTQRNLHLRLQVENPELCSTKCRCVLLALDAAVTRRRRAHLPSVPCRWMGILNRSNETSQDAACVVSLEASSVMILISVLIILIVSTHCFSVIHKVIIHVLFEMRSTLHCFANTSLRKLSPKYSIDAFLEVRHVVCALILPAPHNNTLLICCEITSCLPTTAALR